MDLYAVLDHVLALLRQRGRVSYRALKVQFHLDDEQLEALKEELLYTHQAALLAVQSPALVVRALRSVLALGSPLQSTPDPAHHPQDPPGECRAIPP